MLVTLDGIVTDVNPLHPENIRSSMHSLPSKSVTLVIVLQAAGNVEAMCFTHDGIVTDVSPLQPENASYPMLVTLDGSVTEVSPLQY